ncbi:MAG: pantetheine-phosphate adenylyltransferase [Eubacterium aggregans]|uniref:Phosphopantetheine adenylyltransferase n=1 Tax=Eubacterium aggregans TaxID=81409 RepID=A0A1H4CUI6_9FIRM|nr:pantetheine-phosphate adenylyltransferase [Eubacterium aggregans]MDD4692106.1 pantetheine-phosphate adenylyltransferase [Eubacterium aggregans]MEA5074089.1 pantetheine-phosphate adenylyltransferase [Eubacterium aggregans]SEA64080.1 Phosphopantetheine adenylyltransferase [Eubacterium aggregans]
MAKAVYPGSFDPMTTGHLDIIRRASAIFDEIVVCVMVNTTKQYLFPLEQRIALLESALSDRRNIQVDHYEGLLMNYVVDRGIDVVIKGLRNNRDFEYENNMEFFNKRMAKDIDTVYLMASHEHEYISSSAVRELLGFGGDISGLVPPEVEAALRLK